jgi:hypothetical protein
MDSDVTFLYDHIGEKTAVQMLYGDYLVLSGLNEEWPLLRIKVRQIGELLQTGLADTALPPEPEEPAQLIYPEPVQEQTVAQYSEPEPQPEPEVIPEHIPVQTVVSQPAPVYSLPKIEPVVQDIKLSESSPTPSTAKEYAIPIPPMLLDFLTEQDPSQKAKRLVMACAQKLSGLCEKRITLSLHKPYICLWDFDEWKTFAFGEIIQGHLYLSIEKTLMPDADAEDVWVPPSGLCKKPLVRLKVDAITDDLLSRLTNALNHLTKSAVLNV